MLPDAPPWLRRWQQAADDVLLYVDQAWLLTGGVTREEYDRVVAQHAQQAPHEEDDTDEP